MTVVSTGIILNNNSSLINTPKKHQPTRARQLFSFSELAGSDLTLLLESDILLRIFSNLEYQELFVVKRVCSRWKPLCESKSLYQDLHMQSFIVNSRILPISIVKNFLQSLLMDQDELDALKAVCREMPRITFSNQQDNYDSVSSIDLNSLDINSNIVTATAATTTTTGTNNNTATTTTTTSTTSTTFLQPTTSNGASGSTTPPIAIRNSIATAFAATTSSFKSFINNSANSLNTSGSSLSLPPSPNLSHQQIPISINNGHNRVSSLDDTFSVSPTSSNGSSIDGSLTPTSHRRGQSGTPLNEKEQKKKDKSRKEREKRMEESLKSWNEDMIPNWEKRKGTKKLRDLVLQGIPSLVRSKVWPLLIGNDLNITPELFSIFGLRAERAKQKSEANSLGREGSVSLIHLDLPRTFPMLSIFQDEGPLHQSLANVLEAYVCYRPDVGYVQGMSYLAAVFLLILDEFTSFVCLSNFLNNPCYMAFYTMNLSQMELYMKAMDQLMALHVPKIQKHLKELGIQPDIFMIDWVLTVFSKALPLDIASHVWDTIFLDGESVIFQTALGILKMYSKELENSDFDVCMTLLTHLPPNIDEDELFQHINSFTINQKIFNKLVTNKK
ncbi:hypothetical protein DICPUDRAFT_47207 [Dictyostelium purpureum]|uniref:Rab-GAP TBC domain-containing protein n=1 Tax=Dictyostelium purpureum TaxID=5786 RepID=F0ZIB7_DICPU|nr:uncharacterized protein DICPUDRAFT_47207 [Dictyostelium purpureum]EGC36346.1 hypothetical protein DICPUDRAFT_47207 [Dictyostelium purpureum]|eukprot:XP_003287161.1 hypothetical protein DICPUDRAFT_47207 [Dictyostelium purpureum]